MLKTELCPNRGDRTLKQGTLASGTQKVPAVPAPEEGLEHAAGTPRQRKTEHQQRKEKSGAIATAGTDLPGAKLALTGQVRGIAGDHVMEVMCRCDPSTALGVRISEGKGTDVNMHPAVVVPAVEGRPLAAK